MQSLTEFLKRIQTFNLRFSTQEVYCEPFSSRTQQKEGYDISQETQYYNSFTYKSELQVLKDMAIVDILALEERQIRLQLAQLNKVEALIKQIWENYHQYYSESSGIYSPSYLFDIRLHSLFIVINLKPANEDFAISVKFVEDLADSLKLREQFLKELTRAVENLLPEFKSDYELSKTEQEKQQQGKRDQLAIEQAIINEPAKIVNRNPTFTDGTAEQLYSIFKPYFSPEEHSTLEKLLFEYKEPESALVFRGNGNQLADAFKQLFNANLIVGCNQVDLEKWIAPKFLFLSNQGEVREFTEGYLNGLISTKSRPCKSPILKIEQQENKFIVSVARKKKS